MNKLVFICSILVVSATYVMADGEYIITMGSVSGGAGITIRWGCEHNLGSNRWARCKEGPFTIWRNGEAVATVENTLSWRDYDVTVGASYEYYVTGFGTRSKTTETMTCTFDYVSEVDGTSMVFDERAGSRTLPARTYKRVMDDKGAITTTRAGFYDVSSSETWIKTASYNSSDELFTITVKPNPSEEPRSATVTFRDGMYRYYEIQVMQAAQGSNIFVVPDAGGEVAIPRTWIEKNAASILAAHNGDHGSAALATAANGVNKVWECYVAGLVPTNAAARFEARITFGPGGTPRISWDPDLNENGTKTERVYTVEGKTNLTDSWGPTNTSSRFFHVKVGMPE